MLGRAHELATNGIAEAADNKTAISQNANSITSGNVAKNKNFTGVCNWKSCGPKCKAKLRKRPTVLTPQEIDLVFSQLEGVFSLVARLPYGTGMRVMECAQLRVKDVDFGSRDVTIREGKGGKDRITMLPLTLVLPLREQIAQSRLVYENDRLQQRTGVILPHAL